MSLESTLKRLAKAVPVVLANLPAVLAAAKEVTHAVKKPKKAEPSAGAGEVAVAGLTDAADAARP